MIRGAVVHLLNDQPLLADLLEAPVASDTGLLCTNLRTKGGQRPTYVDRMDSTFFFPYAQIRFIEMPTEGAAASEGGATAEGAVEPEPADLELDEDFLRRIREA